MEKYRTRTKENMYRTERAVVNLMILHVEAHAKVDYEGEPNVYAIATPRRRSHYSGFVAVVVPQRTLRPRDCRRASSARTLRNENM